MSCSNCNVVDCNFGEDEARVIMCENGHFLCRKCILSTNNKCIQCGGRLYDSNMLFEQHNNNWVLEMIRDCSILKEKPAHYSSDSLNGEIDAPPPTASINLLFSREKAFDDESLHTSNVWDLEWKQANDRINPTMYENIPQNSFLHSKNSKHIENSQYMEQENTVVRKDTRQNLVDQTRDEIREKIKEEMYSLFKTDPRSLIRPEECICVKQCKTIGVSTESEPNLLPEAQSCKKSNEHLVEVVKFDENKLSQGCQEVSVVNVDTKQMPSSASWEQSKDNSSSRVDQQFQKVSQAIPESCAEPTKEDDYFYEMLREKFSNMPPTKIEQIISSICSTQKSTQSDVIHPSNRNDELPERKTFLLKSYSSRAFYSPPNCQKIAELPNSQFQQIKTNANPPIQIVDATTLNISRSPVICPVSSCRQAFFVSDFTRHIAVDHTKVPMERVFPHQCKNFFLDPKLIHFDSSRCQILLLVNDKIRNLGHEKFKDFIPILVMTTRVSSLELCYSKPESRNKDSKNITRSFLMIWLTGIIPPQVPIFFSLTVWARSGNMPSCHIVHSGQLYSVRNLQNPTTIQESGQVVLLSENQVDLLTNKGRNMLELQVEIH